MKTLQLRNTFILILVFSACTEQPADTTVITQELRSGYDADLAKSLGADPYGMRQYVMAFLKKGPNRDRDSTEAAQLQIAHLENIGRLAREGKLSLAGPFLDEGDVRGIYIFNVADTAEARKLTETDPAIQAGSLIMELRPWYGSAALQQVNDLQKRIQKEGLTD